MGRVGDMNASNGENTKMESINWINFMWSIIDSVCEKN